MYIHRLLFFLLPVSSLFANPGFVDDELRRSYIATYQDIAVREMHRSGIPASITLAQGILESQWGQGHLATGSQNHFGIKCKTEWTGKRYQHKDDDYENGRLVESCFRAYDFPEDSYIDHTNFLVGNPRYAMLFQLDAHDYGAWARGLRQCGYATDRAYAAKLIRIIEENDLARFDRYTLPVSVSVPVDSTPVAAVVTALDPPRLFVPADHEPAAAPVVTPAPTPAPTGTPAKALVLPTNLAKQRPTHGPVLLRTETRQEGRQLRRSLRAQVERR